MFQLNVRNWRLSEGLSIEKVIKDSWGCLDFPHHTPSPLIWLGSRQKKKFHSTYCCSHTGWPLCESPLTSTYSIYHVLYILKINNDSIAIYWIFWEQGGASKILLGWRSDTVGGWRRTWRWINGDSDIGTYSGIGAQVCIAFVAIGVPRPTTHTAVVGCGNLQEEHADCLECDPALYIHWDMM